MKPPSIVKVMGYDVRIMLMEELESLAHGIYGHFSEVELCIRLNENLPKLKMYNTLKHELKHAAWYAGGLEDSDEEERVVTILSNVECCIDRDNPDLIKFYNWCLK